MRSGRDTASRTRWMKSRSNKVGKAFRRKPNFGGGADSKKTRWPRRTEMTLAGGLPVLGGAVLRRGGEGRPQSVPDLPNVRCIPAWGSPPDKFVGFFLDESWPNVLKGWHAVCVLLFREKPCFQPLLSCHSLWPQGTCRGPPPGGLDRFDGIEGASAFFVQLAGVGVLPLGGLHDPALFDAGGLHLDSTWNAVNDCIYGLEVGTKGPTGDARDFRTDTAEVFGFTAGCDGISNLGTGTGEMANSWHRVTPEKASRSLYPNERHRASLWQPISWILGPQAASAWSWRRSAKAIFSAPMASAVTTNRAPSPISGRS